MNSINIFVKNYPTARGLGHNIYNVYFCDTNEKVAMEMEFSEKNLCSYATLSKALKVTFDAARATFPNIPDIIWHFQNDNAARVLDKNLVKMGRKSWQHLHLLNEWRNSNDQLNTRTISGIRF